MSKTPNWGWASGLVLGLTIGFIGCLYVSNKPIKGVPGSPAPVLSGKVATPEVRTVYVYKDVPTPKGTEAGSKVLTAVSIKEGVATALISQQGVPSIVIQKAKLPWLAENREWHGGLYALASDNGVVYRGTLEKHLYQIRGAYISAVLSADKAPDGFKVVGGIGVRF